MANILLFGLTVTGTDAVVLSAAVTVSFHYCGENTNVSEIGFAIQGTNDYLGWVGNTIKIDGIVKFGRSKTRFKRKKERKKERKK